MARSFNGSSYLTAGSDIAAADLLAPFSIHAWIAPTGFASGAIVAKYTGGGGGGQYLFRMNANRVGLFCLDAGSGGHEGLSPAIIQSSDWIPVGGRMTEGFVLDAFAKGIRGTPDSVGSSNPNNAQTMKIGQRGDFGEAFSGAVAMVALWRAALTDHEFLMLARGAAPWLVRPGNFAAFWPLDDDATTANDMLDGSTTNQLAPGGGTPGNVPGPFDGRGRISVPFMFGGEQVLTPTDIAAPFLSVGTGIFAPASVTESGLFSGFLNVGVGLFVPTFLDLVYAPFVVLGTRVTSPTMIDGEPPPFVPPSLPGATPGGGPGGSLPPLSSGGLAGIRFYQGPPWRWVVTDLNTRTITFLDRLAAEAVVTYGLDRVWTAKLSMPADNPEINLLHTDGDPFVSEGNRLLYGFRREGGDPKWVCRFAGKILHVEDTGEAEDARTIITAYDPWQLLYQRPMVNYAFEFPDKAGFFSFDNTQTGVIALTWLRNTIFNNGDVGIDVGNLDFATVNNMPGTGYWGGPYVAPWSYRTKSRYETTTQIDVDCQQGMMVGEVWEQMIETGSLDLILTPVYDPIRRPGIMAELGIYQRLGEPRYESVMAWDKPGRNLRAFNSIRDGTKRANTIRYYADQGGPPVGPYLGYANGTSITKYGETWHEEYWPGRIAAVVDALAQLQLTLMENGIHTVSVTPAPERMPFLFTEWFLGDTVPVYTSDKARQENAGFQRIYGIVLNIDENSYEQVPQVLASPTA